MYAKEPKKPKRKASLDTETKAGAEADESGDSSQDTDEEHNSSMFQNNSNQNRI